MPRQQCFGSDDGDHLCQDVPAQFFGFRGKSTSLIIGESKPSKTDLLPENAIFLDQILDDLLLPLV
jgi:hypothetical protein